MSSYDVETEHRSGSALRTKAPEPSHAPGGDTKTVLGLQRLAGNSAVSRAIADGRFGSSGQLDVQRLDDDEDFEDVEEEFEESGLAPAEDLEEADETDEDETEEEAGEEMSGGDLEDDTEEDETEE